MRKFVQEIKNQPKDVLWTLRVKEIEVQTKVFQAALVDNHFYVSCFVINETKNE